MLVLSLAAFGVVASADRATPLDGPGLLPLATVSTPTPSGLIGGESIAVNYDLGFGATPFDSALRTTW